QDRRGVRARIRCLAYRRGAHLSRSPSLGRFEHRSEVHPFLGAPAAPRASRKEKSFSRRQGSREGEACQGGGEAAYGTLSPRRAGAGSEKARRGPTQGDERRAARSAEG